MSEVPLYLAAEHAHEDNLMVRIHFIIVMIRWTGLAPWEVSSYLAAEHASEEVVDLAQPLYRVSCFVFRVSGFGFRVTGSRFRGSGIGLGFRGSGFGWVPGRRFPGAACGSGSLR